MTACVAQAESKKISREVPFVDLILGPDQIEEVPELLQSLTDTRRPLDTCSNERSQPVCKYHQGLQ